MRSTGCTPFPVIAAVAVVASENVMVRVALFAPNDAGSNTTCSAHVLPSGMVGSVSQLVPVLAGATLKSAGSSIAIPVTVTSAPLVFVNVSVVETDCPMSTSPKSNDAGSNVPSAANAEPGNARNARTPTTRLPKSRVLPEVISPPTPSPIDRGTKQYQRGPGDGGRAATVHPNREEGGVGDAEGGARQSGADRVQAGPGVHGNVRVLRRAQRRGVDRDDPPSARAGHHPARHGRHLRPAHERAPRRQRDRRPPRRGRAGDEVRH